MTRPSQVPTLSIAGVAVAWGRDAGTEFQYEIRLEQKQEDDAVLAILRALEPNHQVAFDGQGPPEFYEGVRATAGGLEVRTSYHGCPGTWRRATFDEAVERLRRCIPRSELAWRHHRGYYSIEK